MGTYDDFTYGANREESKSFGRPPRTRQQVYEVLKEASADGADVPTAQVVDRIMEQRERAGKPGKRTTVQRQVSRILGKLKDEGLAESEELEKLGDRQKRGITPGGTAIVWKLAGSQQHERPPIGEPQQRRHSEPLIGTEKQAGEEQAAWERRMDAYRTKAPENQGRQRSAPNAPKPQRESWVDKQARQHRERLEDQRDKAPENQGRARGGRSSGGGQQSKSFVDKQREAHEANLAAQRAKSEGKPAQPKGGEDEGGGAGIFKKV